MSEQGLVRQESSVVAMRERMEEERQRVEMIREYQKSVLRKGIDYGEIPGAGRKLVLFKPGAESLLRWHRFSVPDPIIIAEDHNWETGHHYFTVKQVVTDEMGRSWAMIRAASSAEKKFKRYRGEDVDVDATNSQVDNILAMANKRALVAVTRLATATSGLFDEEYEENKPPPPPPARKPTRPTKYGASGPPTDPKQDEWRAGFAGQLETLMASLDKDGAIWSRIIGAHGIAVTGEVPNRDKALQLFREYQENLDKVVPDDKEADQPEMPV